jgi:hypothetical protein
MRSVRLRTRRLDTEVSMRPKSTVGRSAVAVVSVAAAAGYAGWASGTTPFTVAADVAVSIPSAGFAAAFVLQRRWPHAGPWRLLAADRPTGAGGALPWVLVFALLVGSELASYFAGGSRTVHPTLSSLEVAAFHYRAVKAAAFLVWTAIGVYLVRR